MTKKKVKELRANAITNRLKLKAKFPAALETQLPLPVKQIFDLTYECSKAVKEYSKNLAYSKAFIEDKMQF